LQINVTMKSSVIGLDEVVAIGYGVQKKKEVTGAVVQVKAEDLTKMSTSDLGTALQGQVAGVSIMASSGEPGASSNIQIRGISSVNGNNTPLFVVDGVPMEGDPQLSSSEIETVDILKDAASCAIYGTRGAAGVILITTKQGKSGDMKISIDSYRGIQKITSGVELMDAKEWIYQYWIQKDNTENGGFDLTNYWHVLDDIQANGTNFRKVQNDTNISDIIQNDNAIVESYSLNVSGGSDNLIYNVSGSYFNQDGVLINSGFERFSLRSNTTYKTGKWVIKTGLSFKNEVKMRPPNNFLYEIYKYQPYKDAIDVDAISFDSGESSNDGIRTGAVIAKLKQKDKETIEQFNLNLDLNYEIAKDLKFTAKLGSSYANSNRKLHNPLFNIIDNDGEFVMNYQMRSGIRNFSSRKTSTTFETGLDYLKKIGKHKIKLLAVFSTEKYSTTSFWASKKDLFSSDLAVLEAGTSEDNVGSGPDRTNTRIGTLGRLQYDYKGRYLLSLSARRDASSRFREDNRWGTFPSASVGWNIADESFWKPISAVVNSFKLRGSIGTTGNDNFQDYLSAAHIVTGYDYAFGNESINNTYLEYGGIQTDLANAFIKWETTIQRNIGIDLGFWGNKVTFTADVYNTDKKDMLFPYLLPASSGAGSMQSVILNIGDMNNKGYEFALGYRHAGKFSWGVNGTYTHNKNEVTNMGGSQTLSYFADGKPVDDGNMKAPVTAVAKGYEAGAYFVYETDGLVNTEEKLNDYRKLFPTAKMGDLMYVDQNNDGEINELDKKYAGSGTPDFEVGASFNCDYKGIDFSMTWFGAYGAELFNGTKIMTYNKDMHKDLIYQYHENNVFTSVPANNGTEYNYQSFTDYWIEDGSFIRLKNITLGYTLPKRFVDKIGINSCRFYLASDNPITLTKYTGFDPEVGNDGLKTRGLDKGNYPISSQYRVGVQVRF